MKNVLELDAVRRCHVFHAVEKVQKRQNIQLFVKSVNQLTVNAKQKKQKQQRNPIKSKKKRMTD